MSPTTRRTSKVGRGSQVTESAVEVAAAVQAAALGARLGLGPLGAESYGAHLGTAQGRQSVASLLSTLLAIP
jgi:hypothetical protein